mgnify:FL=1
MLNNSNDRLEELLDDDFDLLHKIFTLISRHKWMNWRRLIKCVFKYAKIDWREELSDHYFTRIKYLAESLKTSQVNFRNIVIYGDTIGALSYLLLDQNRHAFKTLRQIAADSTYLKIADEINIEHMRNDWEFKSCLQPQMETNLSVSNYETIRCSDESRLDCAFDFDSILLDKAENISNLANVLKTAPANKIYVISFATNPELSKFQPQVSSIDDLKTITNFKETYSETVIKLTHTDLWVLIGKK